MSETIEEQQEGILNQLPPSAWMRSGSTKIDNTWAVCVRKGGTSKTSGTLITADALARFGLNVLVIDADPQGNSSIGLDSEVRLVDAGVSKLGNKRIQEPDRLTIVEVIDADGDGVIDEGFQLVDWPYDTEASFTRGGPLIPGHIGHIGVVPCYEALESFAEQWTIRDLNRLSHALLNPTVKGGVAPHQRWDVVLLDLPPGGGKIGRMAAKAAHHALMITTAEMFGIKAVSDTLKFLRDIQDNWGHPDLNIAGLVFSSFNPKLTETRNQIDELQEAKRLGNEQANVDVWSPSIPQRTAIPTSQGYRAPVSALLANAKTREGATQVCQVGEALALRMLHHMDHPMAEELQSRWESAWPSPLSSFVTGKWGSA